MIMGKTEDYPETKIEKTVNVLFDGKQYFIKFPTELSEYFKIERGYKCRLTAIIPEKKINILETQGYFKIIKGKYYGKKKKKSGFKSV